MNPSMDDRRILAEMERRLARDDPELVSLMDSLNGQLTDEHGDDHVGDDDREYHDWHWKAALLFAAVAVVGMILAAIFTKPSPADDNQVPPNGLVPAVSVHTQHRVRSPPGRPRRRPGPQAARSPASHPDGGPHART